MTHQQVTATTCPGMTWILQPLTAIISHQMREYYRSSDMLP